jgi:hypothetical protein
MKKIKKTVRTPRPTPLWIFSSASLHPNSSVAFSLQCVDKQLDWIMRRLTPDMERVLIRRRQKPEYVCQLCGDKFAKGCALGGHMSKRHANRRGGEMSRQQMEQSSSTMTPNHGDSHSPKQQPTAAPETALGLQQASLKIGATCSLPSCHASQ